MWRTVKLGDVCNISIGKTPSRSDKRYWDKEKQTDNVWLSIADLTSANGRYIWDSKEYVSKDGANLVKPVPKNTLVMSFKLSIGKLAFTQCELRTNEAIAALSVKDEMLISKEYLYHYLSSFNWDVIAGKDEKVKGKTLNKKKLNELKITFPPLAEQQRIVAKLDAAFAEIDRAIELAQEAKKIASKIGEASIKGALANQYFEWQTIDLGTIAENLDAKRVPITKSKRVKGDVPYYGASGIVDYVDGHLFDEELLLISEDGANLLMRTYPIAFSVSGKIWVNNHAHVLRFSDRHTQKWVERYLNATDLANFISGMAQPKLNQKKLNSIKIPLPNGKYMNELLSVIDITKQKSEELVKVQSEKTLQLVQLKSAILAQELQSSEAA